MEHKSSTVFYYNHPGKGFVIVSVPGEGMPSSKSPMVKQCNACVMIVTFRDWTFLNEGYNL